MKNLVFLALVLIGTWAFASQKSDQAHRTDPWAGTWKFDAGQSKLHGPAPKEETVKSSGTAGGTVKYSITGTTADGKPINESYDGKSDGKPYPFLADGKEVAQISYHRDSSHQYTNHGTNSDGSTTTGTVTLSKDGKTLTIQEHVKAPQGEFDQTIVYTRQ